MNYLKRIEILENLINQIQNLHSKNYNSPVFRVWKNDVHEALKKIYGEESFELEQFIRVDFAYMGRRRMNGTDYNALDKQYFQNGLNEAIEYLNLYKNRINKEDNQMDDDVDSNTSISNNSNIQTRKIFISHASKDKELVGELIDLLEYIGVDASQIFCSSFEGYGIPLGADFLQTIKNELSQDVLVLFVLTDNFYQSAVCMCEMGAAWVLSKNHIPIVVPPLEYQDIQGVIANTQALKINDKDKLNSLKAQIESLFELQANANHSGWERKRNRAIEAFERLAAQQTPENV